MKKLILLLTLCYSVLGQGEIVRLAHTNYTSYFDKSRHYPYLVECTLTKAMVSCENRLVRKNNFRPDPTLPNETDLESSYLSSGYDRGHVMPAIQNQCQSQRIQDECFYFSNMMPQTHALNAGDWKSLEEYTNELAIKYGQVKIWAGGIGEKGKIGIVSIPERCYKVIYIEQTNKWLYYLFNNDKSIQDGFENNQVEKTLIDSLVKINY